MSYINLDKSKLINLEYSLSKELLRSNRAGSYSCTTIINCNTRKYHGLLIARQPAIDDENHVLLSTLDETVIQRDAEFNLGIHKYQNDIYIPKGHKYIRDFSTEPIPKLTYRVGGVVLTKEMIFTNLDDRIILKYTLVDAHSPTALRLRPFLAYRNVHQLSKSNVFVDTKYANISNGIKMRMYQGYSHLHMQLSKEVEYTHVPDWYYNIEYFQEKDRGYDYLEDLFVPGFFDVKIEKGESIFFSAGLSEINPKYLKRRFNEELKRRQPRDSFEHCLINSAHQFVIKRGHKTEVIAGYPWFGRWGRDTFIALPGLTLTLDDPKTCKAVIDTMISEQNGALFPNIGENDKAEYNSVDAPLWFFWTMQQYSEYINDKPLVWKDYSRNFKAILEGYRDGSIDNISMQENGLIYAGEKSRALTWMDAIVDGIPVTPRIGFAVEINALWYNAVMFALDLAKEVQDDMFVKEWEQLPELIKSSFNNIFWDDNRSYLADYVDNDYKDWSVRPNMVFATSLPFIMLDDEKVKMVLDKIQAELLTPRGLRTLAPKNPLYQGIYSGDQRMRDNAYHQGTVWPWLLGHYVDAYLRIHGKSAINLVKNLYQGFEDTVKEHGIGSISEVYDGDPPHNPGGSISQAWSVGEILRIGKMIGALEKI